MDWQRIEQEVEFQAASLARKHNDEYRYDEPHNLVSSSSKVLSPYERNNNSFSDSVFSSTKEMIELKSLVSENNSSLTRVEEKVNLHEQHHRTALNSLSAISLRTQKLERFSEEVTGTIGNLLQDSTEISNQTKALHGTVKIVDQRLRRYEEVFARQETVGDLAQMLAQTVDHMKLFTEETSLRVETASLRSFQSAAFSDTLLNALANICQQAPQPFLSNNPEAKLPVEYSRDFAKSIPELDSSVDDIAYLLRTAIMSIATATVKPRDTVAQQKVQPNNTRQEDNMLNDKILEIVSSAITSYRTEFNSKVFSTTSLSFSEAYFFVPVL